MLVPELEEEEREGLPASGSSRRATGPASQLAEWAESGRALFPQRMLFLAKSWHSPGISPFPSSFPEAVSPWACIFPSQPHSVPEDSAGQPQSVYFSF